MTSSPSEALVSELVPGELPVRLAARAIDVVVVTVAVAALGLAMGFGFDWLVIGALSIYGYFVIGAHLGASLGKRALGLKVIGASGGPPTWKEALVRESFTIVGAVPFVGPLLALVAWVVIVVTVRKSPLRQGQHDVLAGGTRVVRG